MKKYEVTIYYTTNVTIVVDADNEEEALANALLDAGKREYDEQILNNITADDFIEPDVEEVEDE